MSDDRQEPPADDATRPLPRNADHEPLDATARHEPLDATARHEPLDATARHEPVDSTRPLPPNEAVTGSGPSGPPVWSGRAGVPPPRPAEYREPAEWYPDEQRGRRWWMPILLGILALLLLALIGTGVWLVLRSAGDDGSTPPPAPTRAPVTTAAPSTAAPSTAAPTTTEPTSAAPTSTAPTSESPSSSSPPTTTAAARVPMPPLTGLSRTTAQSVLRRLGLSYRVETRPSDQAAGTVIETDPAAGEPVSPDDEVTLVVAEAPESSPTGRTRRPTVEPTATR